MTPSNLYDDKAFGLRCVGAGWSGLVAPLYEHIAWLRAEGFTVCVDQVKEKFGGLRFYWSGPDLPLDKYEPLATAVHDAVQRSFRVCEVCGADGTLQLNNRGWWKTLCLSHGDPNGPTQQQENAS